MAPVIGMYDDAGEEDGPIEIAKLSHPSGIAARGSVITLQNILENTKVQFV